MCPTRSLAILIILMSVPPLTAQERHWAFVPPRRPALPAVRDADWCRTPIDRFLLARLEREGLGPSPSADKITLLRRASLDLTGLPPTPEHVDAFLADQRPDAYERAVDRLLASPRFGERMARRWLDAARYADTNGYQSDGERVMWRWRDWVIDAYNANLPFDRFTIEQLAGDLLPHATLAQRIATGFNRNHRGNGEGGVIPEEYAVEYVVDRVDTTATVWLGLTIGCARCHDHKYDPIKQKEYYQLFAFFNNIPEHGRAIKYGNSPPYLVTPTRDQLQALERMDEAIARVDEALRRLEPEIARRQSEWEKSLSSDSKRRWRPTRHRTAHLPLDDDASGVVDRAAGFDGRRVIDAGDHANFGFYDKFSFSVWVYPECDTGTILSRMTQLPRGDGIELRLQDGKVQLNLVKRWLDDALRVQTQAALAPKRWQHIAVSYDGSRVAGGLRFYIDGAPAELTVLLDELNQSFATKEPLRIGGGGEAESRFRGRIDDVDVYARVISAEEATWLADRQPLSAIAAIPDDKRSGAQRNRLRHAFLESDAPPDWRAARERNLALREQRQRFVESFPTTMVMEEMPQPRDAFVLIRGEYDKRGEKVGPGVPAGFPRLGAPARPNRLDLARWLVAPDHPLTARVAVNRMWQMLFGNGLVKTVDDFGLRGAKASHPELLDWLATEFVRTGWDVKAMLRLMVSSAAYRQSSRSRDFMFHLVDGTDKPPGFEITMLKSDAQKDVDNALLSRGPRMRLSAESIRDQALFAAGLLVERIGGPSVRPYQPLGLGKELGADPYEQDHGESLYRRSLYTFWKRTVAPPNMMMFDAAGRETCVVRETRTNTPLQALTLLNDVTYVEAARVLAQRALSEADSPEDRISRMFRRVLCRPPTAHERILLQQGWQGHLLDFRRDPAAAKKLLAQGEAPLPAAVDAAELAAYAAVASIILNLDEAITKE